MPSKQASPEPLDRLQAGLFYLLNHYAGEPCCCVADQIARQLERILHHPLIDLFPELQTQYARALNNWRARAAFEAGSSDRHVLH